jgi:hypothetical protein
MEEYFAPGTETPQDLPGTEGETDGATPAPPPENIRENLF